MQLYFMLGFSSLAKMSHFRSCRPNFKCGFSKKEFQKNVLNESPFKVGVDDQRKKNETSEKFLM
jgi:hypothetical protein